MKTFSSLKVEMLKNPRIKKEYDALGPKFEVIHAIIRRRIKNGLTQAELAKRVGTHQSAIARLESGSINPTVSYLEQVASAIGGKLRISID